MSEKEQQKTSSIEQLKISEYLTETEKETDYLNGLIKKMESLESDLVENAFFDEIEVIDRDLDDLYSTYSEKDIPAEDLNEHNEIKDSLEKFRIKQKELIEKIENKLLELKREDLPKKTISTSKKSTKESNKFENKVFGDLKDLQNKVPKKAKPTKKEIIKEIKKEVVTNKKSKVVGFIEPKELDERMKKSTDKSKVEVNKALSSKKIDKIIDLAKTLEVGKSEKINIRKGIEVTVGIKDKKEVRIRILINNKEVDLKDFKFENEDEVEKVLTAYLNNNFKDKVSSEKKVNKKKEKVTEKEINEIKILTKKTELERKKLIKVLGNFRKKLPDDKSLEKEINSLQEKNDLFFKDALDVSTIDNFKASEKKAKSYFKEQEELIKKLESKLKDKELTKSKEPGSVDKKKEKVSEKKLEYVRNLVEKMNKVDQNRKELFVKLESLDKLVGKNFKNELDILLAQREEILKTKNISTREYTKDEYNKIKKELEAYILEDEKLSSKLEKKIKELNKLKVIKKNKEDIIIEDITDDEVEKTKRKQKYSEMKQERERKPEKKKGLFRRAMEKIGLRSSEEVDVTKKTDKEKFVDRAKKTAYETSTSILGVKFATDILGVAVGKGDIHQAIKERKSKGEIGEKIEEFESAKEKVKKGNKDGVESAEKMENIKEMMNIYQDIKGTMEELKKSGNLSEDQEKEFLQKLKKVSLDYNAGEKDSLGKEKIDVNSVINAYVENKVSGIKIAKDALNTGLMATGLGALRSFAYAGASMAEWGQKLLQKQNRENVLDNSVDATFKKELLNTIKEHGENLSFQSGETKWQKSGNFVKSLGLITRGLGIYHGAEFINGNGPDQMFHNFIKSAEENRIGATIKDNYLEKNAITRFSRLFEGEDVSINRKLDKILGDKSEELKDRLMDRWAGRDINNLDEIDPEKLEEINSILDANGDEWLNNEINDLKQEDISVIEDILKKVTEKERQLILDKWADGKGVDGLKELSYKDLQNSLDSLGSVKWWNEFRASSEYNGLADAKIPDIDMKIAEGRDKLITNDNLEKIKYYVFAQDTKVNSQDLLSNIENKIDKLYEVAIDVAGDDEEGMSKVNKIIQEEFAKNGGNGDIDSVIDKLNQTIGHHEGISHAIMRQLEANPENYGYNADTDGDLEKWAQNKSGQIVIDNDFYNDTKDVQIKDAYESSVKVNYDTKTGEFELDRNIEVDNKEETVRPKPVEKEELNISKSLKIDEDHIMPPMQGDAEHPSGEFIDNAGNKWDIEGYVTGEEGEKYTVITHGKDKLYYFGEQTSEDIKIPGVSEGSFLTRDGSEVGITSTNNEFVFTEGRYDDTSGKTSLDTSVEPVDLSKKTSTEYEIPADKGKGSIIFKKDASGKIIDSEMKGGVRPLFEDEAIKKYTGKDLGAFGLREEIGSKANLTILRSELRALSAGDVLFDSVANKNTPEGRFVLETLRTDMKSLAMTLETPMGELFTADKLREVGLESEITDTTLDQAKIAEVEGVKKEVEDARDRFDKNKEELDVETVRNRFLKNQEELKSDKAKFNKDTEPSLVDIDKSSITIVKSTLDKPISLKVGNDVYSALVVSYKDGSTLNFVYDEKGDLWGYQDGKGPHQGPPTKGYPEELPGMLLVDNLDIQDIDKSPIVIVKSTLENPIQLKVGDGVYSALVVSYKDGSTLNFVYDEKGELWGYQDSKGPHQGPPTKGYPEELPKELSS